MKEFRIVNGMVYRNRRFERADIYIKKGKMYVLAPTAETEKEVESIDARGKKIAPGFIDVHMHGAAGIDVNAANAKDLETICRFTACHGTTSLLCSILTDTEQKPCSKSSTPS